MPTRRKTLSQAGALLATALAKAQSPNAVLQERDRLTVPFGFSSGRAALLIQARIDRRPATLILDSGSSHTIIAAAFLKARPPVLAPAVPGVGVVGDAVGQEVTLELGSRSWRRRVAVMDLSRVLPNYTEHIDGLLGLDLLLEFTRVTLSFPDRSVTFVR